MTTFKKGDAVSWQSHGGTAHGSVEKKLTGETHIKGHKVAASKDDPQYLVKSENGGKAAHKPGALERD
ncbi:DUF2945 domain-containing protein [Sphingomonas sp. BIUV-7]|uniref:DUF2945 domain-containing protein n=1 Tax=Sphingomonas natans TaxID=3063330 RepID=A0ABT8YDH1_9SPHN|nr:DUF2945 domain-containing protein [Sphingomonas sp. BIUV-7]MDO6416366.1 DUF2945 domain-containing protein [Sphingomonas sp. BIUV-7]